MTDPAQSQSTEDHLVVAEPFRLMYRSHNRIPAAQRRVALGELFSQARSNNKKRHLCGALLMSGDTFVQVLEGEEGEVRALFERIERDGRHEHVDLLESGAVAEPVFSRWAMAKVAEEDGPDIPLIAHTDGISPAAGRRTTPEQEAVLDRMRAAARSASRA
jgi:Sensors of blue-light using FAD